MADVHAVWPEVPPEVPPPWRPGEPTEPGRRVPRPPVPLVPPAQRPMEVGAASLLERRVVLLTGPLSHEMATRAAAEIMGLDAERSAEIALRVSGQDGELASALMLADTVDLARSPVVCLAQGAVGGVALAPFCAASRRLAARNATFHLREPRLSLSGRSDELITGAEAVSQQVDQLRTWIVRATGQPDQTVADDMRRGRMLSAETAIDYGLIDETITRSSRPQHGREDAT